MRYQYGIEGRRIIAAKATFCPVEEMEDWLVFVAGFPNVVSWSQYLDAGRNDQRIKK
jgi:hypothetical protein